VLFEAENRRAAVRHFVGANAFKSAATVMQGVAQDMDFGVAPFNHLAVHPDFAVAVFHGGCYWGHLLILIVSIENTKGLSNVRLLQTQKQRF
jgi:hypothetical protein